MTDAKQESARAAFETAMREYIDKGRKPGDFDATPDFWFDRTETGEYEWVRMQDAFTGWMLALAALGADHD